MAVKEGGKYSMLDAALEKMRMENRKQVVHCVVSISRLSAGIADKRDIGEKYRKLFDSCQQRYQGEGPTGILLIYPQHCVHFIEAPWRVLQDVICDLHEMDSNGGCLAGTKLLCFSSNIEQRLFPQWACRVLQLPALPKGESYQTNDPIEQTVAASLRSLYELGVHLSKLPQRELKLTMDSLPEKFPKLLLQQDILEYFLGCSDLTTPTEFSQRYYNPTHVVLDSEVVWPCPVRLFPYDD